MSGRPQPTAVLVRRLRRIARGLDKLVDGDLPIVRRAWANTCLQAAGRLEDLTGGQIAVALRRSADKLDRHVREGFHYDDRLTNEIVDVVEAVALMRAIAAALKEGGDVPVSR